MTRKYTKITAELESMIFALWVDGFTFEEISNLLKNRGINLTKFSISQFSMRHDWMKKKKDLYAASEEYYEDLIKSSKKKQIKAYVMATEALCDTIIKDYMDYKFAPDQFMQDVKNGVRPRPIWMVADAKSAQILLETEKLIAGNWKKEADTQVIINNNSATLSIMSDEDRHNLLLLLGKAKDKTVEGKIVEEPMLAIEGKKNDGT